mgnify:CR=1 FL=1|jgi:hypothetical protein
MKPDTVVKGRIGRLSIEYRHRSPENFFGRFGGGWNWNAGFQAALEAEKNGQKDEADEIISAPAYVPPVVLPKATPKVHGISYRDNWKFRITDPNKIPREYMVPDEKAIGVIVGRLKERCNIPGIEVYCEKVVAAGRR